MKGNDGDIEVAVPEVDDDDDFGWLDCDEDDVVDAEGSKRIENPAINGAEIKEIVVTSSDSLAVGGGRGVHASADLPAGFLIVLEWPILSFGQRSLSATEDIYDTIVEIAHNPAALEVASRLHPSSVADVPPEELRSAQQQVEQLYKKEECGVSLEEAVKLFLVLQHNAFSR